LWDIIAIRSGQVSCKSFSVCQLLCPNAKNPGFTDGYVK